jgi:hypothetical protein
MGFVVHDEVTWGLPKSESFGKMKFICKHTVLEKKDRCRYFVAKIPNFDV